MCEVATPELSTIPYEHDSMIPDALFCVPFLFFLLFG